jgi:regulator of protease activity HflC (stomatin/prohibitin superfamily)
MSRLAALIVLGVVLLFGLIAANMAVGPRYRVWQQGMEGEAKLMRAKQERQILVTQAQAEKDAAQLRADAIAIMGQAAQQFPEYRQQEFMGAFGEALREGHISQIIYVPTEANIPIMEAGHK